jgi:hypothetical protein
MRTKSGFLIEDRNDVIAKVLLFLFSPFIGFLYSLKRINTKSSFVIFFLFALCFGLCFTPENHTRGYIDGQSYAEKFVYNSNISITTFVNDFEQYISFETKDKDFYFNLLTFLVSRFTDNYHVFFLFAAFIFSFFQLKTFKYLTNEKEFDNSYICFLFCFLFLKISIFNINGIRFWTGYWIAMFALFKIFRDNNYKYISLLLLASFCHGTLFLLFPIVFVAIFFKKFTKSWIFLYFLSFFVGNLAFEIILNVQSYLPQFLQSLIDGYTAEEYIEMRNAEGTGFWFVGEIFRYIVRIFLFITMLLIIKSKNQINNDSRTKNIFALLLVLMTFSNFVLAVPSLGVRFMMFTYPLIAYICLLFLKKRYSIFFALIPVFYFMEIFQELRLYTRVLNIDFFITSPIYLMFKYLF